MTPAVEATGISKRFGATLALADAQISIAPGSTHALVGRNGAGKSTLVSVLTGLQRPDGGTLHFHGRPAPPTADRRQWRQRVACVYQKSTVIPELSVAENLFLNRHEEAGPRGRAPWINWRGLRRAAADLLDEFELAVDPARPAGELDVEQQQLVEIARALSTGARFIILDEPTARLDANAIERLFQRMRALSAAGVTLLFISHHLHEVFDVCDTVTVMRDARWVLTRPVAGLSREALVDAMTGEATAGMVPAARPPVPADAPVALEVRDLGLAGSYSGVRLAVRSGELVGVTGSGSSGKVAFAETVAGLRRADIGEIRVRDRAVRPGDVPAAWAAGIGLVPQDRHREGLVPLLSVAENATMPIGDRLGPASVILPARRDKVAADMIARYDIKTSDPGEPVSNLSGGNAQKVVLARALSTGPDVLVLISPTTGVDVRSKETLLDAVLDVATSGTGVLLVSDELDDLRSCDRVLVMYHGEVSRELDRGWDDAEMVAAIEGLAAEEGTP
ncbi:sugar ABC transporter ATP-binding protein [Micromonospora tulbaghiae]|uniref:sugar ABC transporter ATP-binding protein n=1 Tax=Micromonospora tulbaghiae TaxID=479978 RepID=UPI00343FCCE0